MDGNDIAGVHQPSIEVPVATYTGWALRRAPFAEGEDCALTGQYIPFSATRAERLAKGDPRLSLEERYRNHGQYVARVALAADRLVRQRLKSRSELTRLHSILPDGVCDWSKGKLADLVVLSDDPLTVSDDRLRKISSAPMLQAGKIVHNASSRPRGRN